MKESLQWMVLAFERHGKRLLRKYVLPAEDRNAFRKALGKGPTHLLRGSLKIPKAGIPYFEAVLQTQFDVEKEEYYLELRRVLTPTK